MSKVIEDCWSEEERNKFKMLREEEKKDELIDFMVNLMLKYDLSPRVEEGFDVVEAVREGRER